MTHHTPSLGASAALYNKRGQSVCHATGCRRCKNLVNAFNGLFCAPHYQELAVIRGHIKPHDGSLTETAAREAEINFRKQPDAGHVHRAWNQLTQLNPIDPSQVIPKLPSVAVKSETTYKRLVREWCIRHRWTLTYRTRYDVANQFLGSIYLQPNPAHQFQYESANPEEASEHLFSALGPTRGKAQEAAAQRAYIEFCPSSIVPENSTKLETLETFYTNIGH